ncbi:MAG: hypothetical protein ACD_21C00132G0006 [uncultured bacterium]|nr:MAG: hypothetical protein ACD_21C00132G0006 [uncultured bacterium]
MFFSSFADTLFAKSSDDELPAKLSSDSAICKRQDSENVCTYSGKAELSQGTTNLQAQDITIYKKAGSKINKIVASGKQAHYNAILDNNQQVNADAELITIYPDKKMMILEGNGQIIVGRDKYSGPHIEYKFK